MWSAIQIRAENGLRNKGKSSRDSEVRNQVFGEEPGSYEGISLHFCSFLYEAPLKAGPNTDLADVQKIPAEQT